MSTVNVILALSVAVATALRDNFKRIDPEDATQGTVRNDLSPKQKQALRDAYAGRFKSVTVGGTTYIPIDLYIPDRTVSREDPTLYWLEKLKELLPGDEFVVGAWNLDGTQYGTTLVPATIDNDGQQTAPESITGTPVYPIHARLLEIMPDDVTYAPDGSELSRTPAAAPKQVSQASAWADRRWT